MYVPTQQVLVKLLAPCQDLRTEELRTGAVLRRTLQGEAAEAVLSGNGGRLGRSGICVSQSGIGSTRSPGTKS